MKNTSNNRLQSGPDCCNLEFGCKQTSLIDNDLLQISRLHAEVCSKHLQSGIPHNHSISYGNSQIARGVPVLHTGGKTIPPVNVRPRFRLPQVVKKIDFKRVPEIGSVLMFDGQRYELVDSSPYQTREGRPDTILHWQSHCPECGKSFVATSTLKSKCINRRCPKHHKRGVPVAKSKRIALFVRKGGRK